MRFKGISSTRADETKSYSVTEYEAITVVQFIEEVMKRFPEEWGYFSVKNKEGGFFICKKVEYRYGELLNEVPEEWLLCGIEKIEASGGWSRMDYYIYPTPLTEEQLKQFEQKINNTK